MNTPEEGAGRKKYRRRKKLGRDHRNAGGFLSSRNPEEFPPIKLIPVKPRES